MQQRNDSRGLSFNQLQRHPWVAQVPISGPPLGPGQVAWMERCLECLAGSGLSPEARLGVLNLLSGFVLGHFRLYDEIGRAARAHGLSPTEAERSYISVIADLVDPSRFPNVAAAFAAIDDAQLGDPGADFEFGLARILDGVEAMTVSPGAEVGLGQSVDPERQRQLAGVPGLVGDHPLEDRARVWTWRCSPLSRSSSSVSIRSSIGQGSRR